MRRQQKASIHSLSSAPGAFKYRLEITSTSSMLLSPRIAEPLLKSQTRKRFVRERSTNATTFAYSVTPLRSVSVCLHRLRMSWKLNFLMPTSTTKLTGVNTAAGNTRAVVIRRISRLSEVGRLLQLSRWRLDRPHSNIHRCTT